VFPNLQTWRVVPGDPSENAFLRKFSREMSSSLLPLRKNEKVFQTVEEAEGYLDEFRTQEPKNYCRESQEEVDADEEEQKQVCLCDQVGQDGLSQVERQDREISDRCTAQD
jgi:hypothetical protein